MKMTVELTGAEMLNVILDSVKKNFDHEFHDVIDEADVTVTIVKDGEAVIASTIEAARFKIYIGGK